MEIELRLKKILIKQGVDPTRRGLVTELAEYLDVHRHTAKKLLRGNTRNDDTKGVNRISLRVLGELCNWLHRKHDVPLDRLPRDLFAFGPPPVLWEAVSSVSTTTLFLGECLQAEGTGPVRLWVSSRDCTVANAIVEQLCLVKGEFTNGANEIHTEYVPFRFKTDSDDSKTRREYVEEQAKVAKKMFASTHGSRSSSAHIYIGSQEVNGLLEMWVSSLFGCKPFVPATEHAKTPFYVWFRHPDSSVQSCFGGIGPPPGYTGKAGPGIYYRKGNRWLVAPFIETQKDAGLVITYRDPGANIVDAAIFGLSGRATAVMADRVVPDTKYFYPPTLEWNSQQLGVYVCKFDVSGDTLQNSRTYHIKDFDVIPIEEKILKQYLQPRKKRKPDQAE